MGSHSFTRAVLTAAICGVLTFAPVASAMAQTVARPRSSVQTRAAYDTGFREGTERGEAAARSGRAANFEREDDYRSGDRGYNRSWGNRDDYRNEFRRGFAAGYRQAYERIANRRDDRRDRRDDRWDDRRDQRWSRGYQDPATARGYRDGYEKGLEDGRDRDRYDPVRHGDYKDADNGYERDYGSKDAYRNNYRAGFRQGYEDGYRTVGRR